MKEEWKPITVDGEIYENYSVSSEGNIRNDKTGRILKKRKDKYGYEQIGLYKNGKGKTFLVHRLVAEAFIPNPDNKPCIDHINTIRDDNRVENLKWVTHKENNNNPLTRKNNSEARKGENNPMYGRTGEKHPKSTKVICITTGNIYESTREAERQTGVKQSDISNCCNNVKSYKSAGKSKTGEKLVWMFYDDYLKQIEN